ncbi:uncharacterized protein LOC112086515 [Eutrema salsugineum]|uniref:uncharacterized protein LOC112086515 n=1 Tax=Eutrema salsugineum TaxID=72664 RepID=UPI000CED6285|nr:uncharacterized protein LOC112086515 [Eutrema salsugineum]
MSNLAKLEIPALDVSGKNYMSWAVGAKIHLRGNGVLDTIDKSETTSDEKKAKAMIFLLHHIDNSLKEEYITKKNPADLWQSLKDRFDHQKYVILPKVKHEWLNFRFQDYKSVGEYNSAMFGITSRMMLSGQEVSDFDMIEKTLQTFHPGNVILQQLYRAKGYTTYSELMQVLLVAEQNNQLVMLNYQTRPTGSSPFPEVNVASSSPNNRTERGRGRGRNRYPGRGRGHGRGRQNDVDREARKQKETACYRCGMKNHWAKTCRTPRHLADLYRASQDAKEKDKGKNFETNFISDEAGTSFDGISDYTHLDIADFLVDPEESTETKRLRSM